MVTTKLSKLIVGCSVVDVVALNLAPGVARADMTVIVADSYSTAHTIPGGNDGWGTHGGEFLTKPSGFTFTPDRLPSDKADLVREIEQFETFCMERNEFFSFSTVFHVEINTYAAGGGLGGQDSSGIDYIDPKTAWLYQEFIDGTLAGYDYGMGPARIESANALQNALWFIEGEFPGAGYNDLTGREKEFYDAAITANPQDIGSVKVMNLYAINSPRTEKQSHLVSIVTAPAPTAAVLVVIGVGLLSWQKKRLAKLRIVV